MSVHKDRAADRSMATLLLVLVLAIAGISFLTPKQLDPAPGTPAPNPYTASH